MDQHVFTFLRKRAMLLGALLVICGHFIWMMSYFEPAISSPDANGYFAQARLIATTGQTWFSSESLLQYVGGHWIDRGDGRFFSRYPPGLPVVAAIFFMAGGHKAALFVNPLLTAFTLLGLFFLCRLWIGERWAMLAVLVMAFNPVVNGRALTHDAHAAVAFFLVWGIYLLAQWSISKSVVGGFFAGLCLGLFQLFDIQKLFLVWQLACLCCDWPTKILKRGRLFCLQLGAQFFQWLRSLCAITLHLAHSGKRDTV